MRRSILSALSFTSRKRGFLVIGSNNWAQRSKNGPVPVNKRSIRKYRTLRCIWLSFIKPMMIKKNGKIKMNSHHHLTRIWRIDRPNRFCTDKNSVKEISCVLKAQIPTIRLYFWIFYIGHYLLLEFN